MWQGFEAQYDAAIYVSLPTSADCCPVADTYVDRTTICDGLQEQVTRNTEHNSHVRQQRR